MSENNNEVVVRMVRLEEIRPSRTNPRKRFDGASLKELQGSIAEKGLVSPLLIRPVTGGEKGVLYELVAGERRFWCLTALAVESVPCLVRALTDQQALELQIIENLQRDDLDYIEEAEGYEKLLEMGDYTAKELAAKLSKSVKYVYERLKLLFLPASGRAALLLGRLSFSAARQIACLPHEEWRLEATRIALTPKACKVPEVENEFYEKADGEPLTVREVGELLTSRYMRELKGAPFDPKDEKLVPAAGPCAACPKRAGNAPELFPELRPDMCTDVKCFSAKQEAARLKLVAEEKAAGRKVLSVDECAKIFRPQHGGGFDLAYDAPYVSADEEPEFSELADGVTKRPKWKSLVKDAGVPVVVAVDPAGGVHELMEHKLALTAAKAAKPELFRKRETSLGSARDKAEAEKRKIEEEIERTVFEDVVDAVVVKIEKQWVDGYLPPLLEAALDFCYEFAPESLLRICTRRRLDGRIDWGDLDSVESHAALIDHIADLKTPESKLGLLAELLLTLIDDRGGPLELDWFAKVAKLDLAKLGARAKTILLEKRELPKKAALSPAGAKIVAKTVSASPAKMPPLTGLGKQIVEVLIAAGLAGITVKEIAAKTKMKPGNIFSWFYTTGKKIGGIRKVGEAKYAYVAAAEKAGAK